MESKEDVESLIHALKDEHWDVRWKAARSLAVLTVLSEEIVKTTIHDYESKIEEQDRDSFQKFKKLYEQELKKTASEKLKNRKLLT